MLIEAASGITLHDDPLTSTPIVENAGSTTTTYVLESTQSVIHPPSLSRLTKGAGYRRLTR